jgi:hypothetical protein
MLTLGKNGDIKRGCIRCGKAIEGDAITVPHNDGTGVSLRHYHTDCAAQQIYEMAGERPHIANKMAEKKEYVNTRAYEAYEREQNNTPTSKVDALVEKLQDVFLDEVMGTERKTQLLTEAEQESAVERFSAWVGDNSFSVQ